MAEQGKGLAVREGETAVSLLDQARGRLAVAEDVAKLLTATIKKHKLFAELTFKTREGGKVVGSRVSRHVRFEGWTTAGTLLEFIMGHSVHPVTVWTKPLPFPEGRGASDYPQGTYGFAARVEARTGDGQVLGGAETSVTRDETRWRNADDYAIMSMAQTRAGSKALRGPLGWIIALAGFDQTPAEEMDGIRNGVDPKPQQRGRPGQGPPPKANGKQWLCPKCDKEDGKRIWNPSTAEKCGKCGCPRPGTTAPAKVTSSTPVSQGDALSGAMAQAETESAQLGREPTADADGVVVEEPLPDASTGDTATADEPQPEPPETQGDEFPDTDQLKAEDAARDAAEDADAAEPDAA
jgi:hypothetical protein